MATPHFPHPEKWIASLLDPLGFSSLYQCHCLLCKFTPVSVFIPWEFLRGKDHAIFISGSCHAQDSPGGELVLTKCLFYVNFGLQTSYHLMLTPCHQNEIINIANFQTRKIWFKNEKSLEIMSNRKKHFEDYIPSTAKDSSFLGCMSSFQPYRIRLFNHPYRKFNL